MRKKKQQKKQEKRAKRAELTTNFNSACLLLMLVTVRRCGKRVPSRLSSYVGTSRSMTTNLRPEDVKVSTLPILAPLFQDEQNPPLVLDVRDLDEVHRGKGGPPKAISGSINVPLNHDGVGQRERLTTLGEFLAKLDEEGVVLPDKKDAVIVTHCGSGGRGGKAAALLKQAGYYNAHNGGGPSHIATAMMVGEEHDGGEQH